MIVATFRDEAGLVHALRRLRAARLGPLETYTPAPVEGEDTASAIPLMVLAAGLLGAAASFALQVYSSTKSYPLNIGGRPNFAWVSFIPNVFENAILVAVVAGFGGFLVINRMPRLHESVDEARAMRRASSDRWCVAVRTDDTVTLAQARTMLRELDADDLEEVA